MVYYEDNKPLKGSVSVLEPERVLGDTDFVYSVDKFLKDWSLDFASMLAYNLLISLLPIAITIFGIFDLILKDNPQATQDLKDKIINPFPSDNTTRTGIKQV